MRIVHLIPKTKTVLVSKRMCVGRMQVSEEDYCDYKFSLSMGFSHDLEGATNLEKGISLHKIVQVSSTSMEKMPTEKFLIS